MEILPIKIAEMIAHLGTLQMKKAATIRAKKKGSALEQQIVEIAAVSIETCAEEVLELAIEIKNLSEGVGHPEVKK